MMIDPPEAYVPAPELPSLERAFSDPGVPVIGSRSSVFDRHLAYRAQLESLAVHHVLPASETLILNMLDHRDMRKADAPGHTPIATNVALNPSFYDGLTTGFRNLVAAGDVARYGFLRRVFAGDGYELTEQGHHRLSEERHSLSEIREEISYDFPHERSIVANAGFVPEVLFYLKQFSADPTTASRHIAGDRVTFTAWLADELSNLQAGYENRRLRSSLAGLLRDRADGHGAPSNGIPAQGTPYDPVSAHEVGAPVHHDRRRIPAQSAPCDPPSAHEIAYSLDSAPAARLRHAGPDAVEIDGTVED